MADQPDSTGHTQQLLNRLAQGDDRAVADLIEHSIDRLRRLARTKLRKFSRVRRWEDTDDVLQNVAQGFARALRDVRPTDTKAYIGLAIEQIQWELLDLSRHHYGPEGQGAHHHTDHCKSDEDQRDPGHPGVQEDSDAGGSLEEMTLLHEKAQIMPVEEKDVFDRIYYMGMQQEDVARDLGVSVPTVKRHWRSARLWLREALRNG